MPHEQPAIAVLIPCYNEAVTIASVVEDFRRRLPRAEIFVYDNNSTDDTVEVAARAGAVVRSEPQQGKGHVVRRMFSDVEADLYLLVDGDDTYDAGSAPKMIETMLRERCDMVNGKRISELPEEAYRFGHRFGNRLLTDIVGWIFGRRFDDILSGYRVLSRRFVKSFPALSTGFEIETELTIHALSLNMPIAEVDTPYKTRPEESSSKLNTWWDGFRILRTILLLAKEERPQLIFSTAALLLALVSLLLGLPVVAEWLRTGLVPRFPTAILSASLMLLAFFSFATGLILSSVSRARREIRRLHYLNLPWLGDYAGEGGAVRGGTAG